MRRIATAFALWAGLTIVAAINARLWLGPLDWGVWLIIACAALVMLPPSLDPAIQIKRRREEARQRARGGDERDALPVHINCRCWLSPRTMGENDDG